MRRYLDLGYDTVKMKIGGVPLADDMKRIEAVLAVVGEGRRLAVDVNGRFDLQTGLDYARAIAPLNPALVRRTVRPARLPAACRPGARVCRADREPGENLFSMQDARN